VLVSGTSLYNELIRSCLPTMYESTVDNDLEVGSHGSILLSNCALLLKCDVASMLTELADSMLSCMWHHKGLISPCEFWSPPCNVSHCGIIAGPGCCFMF